jgi:hypothetical protein
MKVGLFTLGRTIASTHDSPPAARLSGGPAAGGTGGVAPSLTGADLLAAVPGLNTLGIELDIHGFFRVPGASIAITDVIALAGAIRRRITAAPGCQQLRRTGPTAIEAVGGPSPRSVASISTVPPGNVNGPFVTHWP